MGIRVTSRARSTTRLVVAGLVATLVTAVGVSGVGPAVAAAGGPTLSGASTGDLIRPDTPLTVQSPDGGDVVVKAYTVSPDGSIGHLYLNSILRREPWGNLRLRSGETFTPGVLTPSGGDLRLVLSGCSVDDPDRCHQPGQQIDVGLDAPLAGSFDHLAWNDGSGHGVLGGTFWRDQAMDMSVSLTEPDGEVVLGPFDRPGRPAWDNNFYLPTDGALPMHPYRLHVDMTRSSAVVPGTTYHGSKDLTVLAGSDFTNDATISQARILTVPHQRIQHSTVQLSSVLAGEVAISIWNSDPNVEGPVASVARQVSAGQPVTLTWDGWDRTTGRPATPGTYVVHAGLNPGGFTQDVVHAGQTVGEITVQPGRWVYRTITRTATAVQSRTRQGTGKCRTVRGPSTRGWTGSLQLWTQSCHAFGVLAWTRHSMVIPQVRYNIVSADLEAFGGASIGHPGSTAVAEPFDAHPIRLGDTVGWHHIRRLTGVALDGHQIVCYVRTHAGNSYDLGRLRVRYQVEDHLIPG